MNYSGQKNSLSPLASISCVVDHLVGAGDERGRDGKESRARDVRTLCALAARQAEGEDRTLARLARHGHVAAHHARELARDSEPEPRSPEALSGGGIGLAELLEQLSLLLRGHADAGIGDREFDEVAAIAHLGTKKMPRLGLGACRGIWHRMLVVGFDRRGDITKLRFTIRLLSRAHWRLKKKPRSGRGLRKPQSLGDSTSGTHYVRQRFLTERPARTSPCQRRPY
jgi:hypothetical protein